MPIQINQSKCIGCGLCIKDCVSGTLEMQNGKAAVKPTRCIECGHCFAICSSGAVSMPGYDTADCGSFVSMEKIDSKTLLAAMKSRRTIRQFKDLPVEQEKIDMILEAGRYCPTGVNAQNVAYTILGSRQDEIEAQCIALFRKGQKAASPLSKFVRNAAIDDHFLFKGAPLVIVVSSTSDVSACLASSYMELMAESLGLGVLYSGFFVAGAKLSRKVKKLLALPPKYKPVTCMVIGYPDVHYQRTVPRKPLKSNTL